MFVTGGLRLLAVGSHLRDTHACNPHAPPAAHTEPLPCGCHACRVLLQRWFRKCGWRQPCWLPGACFNQQLQAAMAGASHTGLACTHSLTGTSTTGPPPQPTLCRHSSTGVRMRALTTAQPAGTSTSLSESVALQAVSCTLCRSTLASLKFESLRPSAPSCHGWQSSA